MPFGPTCAVVPVAIVTTGGGAVARLLSDGGGSHRDGGCGVALSQGVFTKEQR